MASTFVCVHCGFPCGETGHIKLETPTSPICPNTAPLYSARPASGRLRATQPRAMGYCCPPHNCDQAVPSGRHEAPISNWRSVPATRWQRQKLAQLGHWVAPDAGLTKGEAHDLLSRLLSPPDQKRPKKNSGRAILLREE